MPPKKPVRPAKDAVRLNIELDDVMPAPLMSFLTSLPSEAPLDHLVEPCVKRRKVHDQIAAAHVANAQISFSRRCVDASSQTVTHKNIQKYIRLGCYSSGLFVSRDRYALREYSRFGLSSRCSAETGTLNVVVAMPPQDVSAHAASIINLAAGSVRQNEVGAIWASTDVSLERHEGMATIRFLVQLFWNYTPSPSYTLRGTMDRKRSQFLMDTFYPRPDVSAAALSPMDFYDAAYVPPQDDPTSATIETPMDTTLYPYQKRTLQWMLGREGVRWTSNERIEANEDDTVDTDEFRQVTDIDGRVIYLSDVFHTVAADLAPYSAAHRAVKGGILSEEMGLGKTLEILGLILLHRRKLDEKPRGDLVSSGATLIVTPESLRAQWIAEIAQHAPSLRVKHYQGIKKDPDEVEDLSGYDIVITTYSVLTSELHFAYEPPQRSRRFERVHPRAKSRLVQISWWRLCLDEAQMIESGFSQAAEVARVIPRVNAWGITGTPIKDDVGDLYGLLLFLGYMPYAASKTAWGALLGNKVVFQSLFKSISLRHTKTMVKDELKLPSQKRYVISMPFTAVEEQHYQSLCAEMAEKCGVDAQGNPVLPNWDPKNHEESMRTWLNRLRQTALHPEIGAYSRRTLGQSKTKPLRTVDEVLDAMLEQSEALVRVEQREPLLIKLQRGQLYENGPEVKQALAIWQEVKTETEGLVAEARLKLDAAIEEQKAQTEESEDGMEVGSEEEEEVDTVEKGRVGEYRRRLRGILDLHHRATFFCANAHFQIRENTDMTEPDSEDFQRLKTLETDGYDEAKLIRREILDQPIRKAQDLMALIARKAHGQQFVEMPELVVKSEKGIESARVVDRVEVLYGELNDQANLLDEWREHIVQMLLRPLVDEEDDVETTGEELVDSTKEQEELMVYVTALRAVIADRQQAMTGQTNELVAEDTKRWRRMARDSEGPAPKKLLELLKVRDELQPKMADISIRGAISELRQLRSRLADGARETLEHRIAAGHLAALQKNLGEQMKRATALEAETEIFRGAMNSRIEYYKQLQQVSDGVQPFEGTSTPYLIEKLIRDEEVKRRKMTSSEAKHRYLLNLKEVGSKSTEARICVICQTGFTTGVLTVCGHQFCKACMMQWFKARHNCPVCKMPLKLTNLHDITLKPQQLQVRADVGDETRPQPRAATGVQKGIYSEFNADQLAEITSVELEGPSFTTKVDTLVRHLIWLRESDPGAKSIIFSQYKDFLGVLENAFQRFQIGCSSIDSPKGIQQFKNDPSIECFLLHARAHSSGLNLVNASHVFLCEPLLNTALELQAIARVDRIGQQHDTTVWLYYVTGTVEESVYNLSVRRRLEHMRGASLDAANTLELEQAALSKLMSKDRSAGEVVDKGDLWECLFGHVKPADGGGAREREQAVMGYLAGEAAEARMNHE